ncbi:MAG: hypothetical protein PHV28_16375 [Kiritimatiellae bacterium]|nr:hypothetical protein [Kiritimatiellia bacterium]
MGKSKTKQGRERAAKPVPAAVVSASAAQPTAPARASTAEPANPPLPEKPVQDPVRQPPSSAAPKSRWHRLTPDLLKAALAIAVIGIAAFIWYKPPLIRADFPYLSYCYKGVWLTDAALYRPLAMPTRYYIGLPRQLAERYTWFAVDRRLEVAALTEAPRHRFLGRNAIKRSDPLGLDLEFRKLDHSEWQVHFFTDAIVFSNAVLAVRLDTK